MADWIKNTVMLTVLTIWVVFVIVSLARGADVPTIVWGLPVSMWFALNPSFRKKGGSDGPA